MDNIDTRLERYYCTYRLRELSERLKADLNDTLELLCYLNRYRGKIITIDQFKTIVCWWTCEYPNNVCDILLSSLIKYRFLKEADGGFKVANIMSALEYDLKTFNKITGAM